MFKSDKYDDETLKHLQKVQKMMLTDFIKICEENDILYFVIGGTLLGTIRHGGFIPWDDDIDVLMFRKDFEKLNKIMSEKPNKKYGFINVLNEETYHYTWGRFTLLNTEIREWWADQVDYKPNIFIDIFIMDNIPDNKIKRFVFKWRCFTLNQMVQYSLVKFENESKPKEIIQKLAYYILKIIPISPMTIKKRCVKTYRKYEDIDCEETCDFPSLAFMPIYNKKELFPVKKVKFEDIEVNVPNNYDEILKRLYGNYMELPPEDKRFRPAPEKIDFGEY
ncbi:phosphorylcholine transferase LicD [Methanobrevibacter sp.]|uniref:LicD family protein n=1 Tax=Methanobrevibacter sp. TaxID=66852 RepID=UPI00388EF851